MFCKYCGNTIKPGDSVCVKCGQPVALSGGNGFWDLAGEPPIPDQKINVAKKENVVISEDKGTARMPKLISAALCLLCLCLLIGSSISSNRKLNKIKSEYEEQLSQQKAEYNEQIDLMKAKIEVLEEDITKKPTLPMPINVIWSPTAETEPVGYVNNSGTWLFRFQIEGSAISFQWAKQEKNGEWVELKFDDCGIDPRFGLRLNEDIRQGCSELLAAGLTEESDGNYRCTVQTDSGTESVEVRLTIEADNSAEPTTTSANADEPEDEPGEELTDDSKPDEEPSEDPQTEENVWPYWGHYLGDHHG